MKVFSKSLFSSLLLSCVLLSGCGILPEKVISIHMTTPAVLTTTVNPTVSTQREPFLQSSPETTQFLDNNSSDIRLQHISAENVDRIVPMAILDDSGLYGSILSPDGKQFATNSTYSVTVYNVATGEQTASFAANGAAMLAFSYDGTRLAAIYALPNPQDVVVIRTDKSNTVSAPVRYTMTIWDLSNNQVLFSKNVKELCGEKSFGSLFQYLEDGSLVMANMDLDAGIQSVCRISGQDGTELQRMELDSARGFVRRLAISSDGSMLAAAFSASKYEFNNPALAVYNFPDGQMLFEKSLSIMPRLVFVEPSEQLLYNAKNTEGLATIEVITFSGVLNQSIPIPSDSIIADWFAANDRYLVVPGVNEAIVYDLDGGNEILRIPYIRQDETIFGTGPENDGYIEFFLASDSDILLMNQRCLYLACSNMDDMLRIYDLAHPNSETFRLEMPFWYARRAGDLSPDGQMVAVGGQWNGDVYIWSTQNGQLLLKLQTRHGLIYQTIFSPDSSMLVTVAADGSVCIWDAVSGELLHSLIGHKGWVLQAVFSPNGTHLITSGEDNILRLWDIETGRELRSFHNPKPEYIVDGMWFTSEKMLLIRLSNLQEECGGCLSTAFLMDIDSGTATELFWERLQVDVSLDDDWLFRIGTGDQRVFYLGRIEQSQLVVKQNILLNAINDSQEIALSPDGKLIYTFNANGLNVFDRTTREQIVLAANRFGILTTGRGKMEASPDGRFLVDFAGGSIVLWGIPE